MFQANGITANYGTVLSIISFNNNRKIIHTLETCLSPSKNIYLVKKYRSFFCVCGFFFFLLFLNSLLYRAKSLNRKKKLKFFHLLISLFWILKIFITTQFLFIAIIPERCSRRKQFKLIETISFDTNVESYPTSNRDSKLIYKLMLLVKLFY